MKCRTHFFNTESGRSMTSHDSSRVGRPARAPSVARATSTSNVDARDADDDGTPTTIRRDRRARDRSRGGGDARPGRRTTRRARGEKRWIGFDRGNGPARRERTRARAMCGTDVDVVTRAMRRCAGDGELRARSIAVRDVRGVRERRGGVRGEEDGGRRRASVFSSDARGVGAGRSRAGESAGGGWCGGETASRAFGEGGREGDGGREGGARARARGRSGRTRRRR